MNNFIDDKSKNPIQANPPSRTALQQKPQPRWGLFGFLIILVIQGFLIYQVLGNKTQISESQNQLKFLTEELTANLSSQEKRIKSVNTALLKEKQRIGETQKELQQTKSDNQETTRRIQTQQRRSSRQQQESVKKLDAKISQKADDQELSALKSSAKTQFGTVNKNVESNRAELEKTKKTLEGANRDIMDVRSTLTQQIARNKEELNMLRLKGERDFFEFDITKKQKFVSVGGIKFRLTRTKWKKGRYSIRMVVDDRNIERKSKFVNEPVQFLVGPTKLRYELVVNEVPEKDRIIGYLSVPKNKVLASERGN